MDLPGLLNSVYKAAANIDSGRKGFAMIGEERAGRISYEDGINMAISVFKEALLAADPYIILLVEYTFLSQELQLCDERDKNALVSLKSAIESFDEAFLCLKIVGNRSLYTAVEKCFPHRDKYRVKGFPKDAFHIACSSHRTRLKNMLTTTGVDLTEKSLLEQRRLNLTAAQNSYTKKQKLALEHPTA
ncbi:MAG: hypothetical protein LBI42_15160 [Chitinispirillales bacterium]|nr:hypothetical protein [Chitinispirillales bacterium]